MPNNKLRDLLLKRTHWMGHEATAVANKLTEAIRTFIKAADTKDGAMTYTIQAGTNSGGNATIDGMPHVRHVAVTVDTDKVFCQMRLDNGDTIMIDFAGPSPYNPVDLHRPIKVSKRIRKAAQALRRG